LTENNRFAYTSHRQTESGVGGETRKGLQPLEIGPHMAFGLCWAGSSALAFVFKGGRGCGEKCIYSLPKSPKLPKVAIETQFFQL